MVGNALDTQFTLEIGSGQSHVLPPLRLPTFEKRLMLLEMSIKAQRFLNL